MVAWRWVIGPWFRPPQRELTLARSRKLTYNLTAPALASFAVPGRSDEAGELVEMLTDLWVYADQFLVYRGRVVGVTDTVTANVHTLAVDCVDYRGLLGRRLLVEGDQLNWSVPRYADMAWGLVEGTQAKPGGGLGITQGVWEPDETQPPSNYRVRNYNAGLEVGKALDDLAGVAFDFQIDPQLRMNLWAPERRPASAFVADYGGTVVGFTRSAVASQWANVTRISGDPETTVGVNLYLDSPEGRFEQQVGYPDVVLQSTVDSRAPGDALRWYQRRSALNLDMRPGTVNSPEDVGLGAQIQVALRSGRLDVTGTRTVQEIGITLDDSGVSHVRVGLLT